MSEIFPDRLSADPESPYYNKELLTKGVGIRFKGVEKDNVLEYCLSEQWIRVTVGNTVTRNGKPMTMKLTGPVEVYLRESKENE